MQKIWICSKFAAYLLHMSLNFVANLFFHVFFCKKLRIFYLKQLILDKECSCASFAKKKKVAAELLQLLLPQLLYAFAEISFSLLFWLLQCES